MYVGVILLHLVLSYRLGRVPHVCGGDPKAEHASTEQSRCSPCMWGVILDAISAHEYPSSVPDVCGGDPTLRPSGISTLPCSPCMWG